MSSQPNHYEALGLPPTATPEQIKRKYRELARRYHPDVNASAEAANRIISINQAYRVLGDPDRRATYDAERLVAQTPSAPRPQARPAAQQRQSAAAREPDGTVHFDGFGRAYTRPKAPARKAPPPRATADTQTKPLARILSEAKLAFINRDYTGCYKLCQEALQINPREAAAHEILGDIYLHRGDSERASTAFSYAVQFNPRNQSAQAKLNRLMRAGPAPAHGPTVTFTRPAYLGAARGRTPDFVLAFISMLAGGIAIATPILIAFFPGSPSADGLAWMFGLSYNLLAALVVGGMASGVLLAFYGRMRPFTEEAWRTVRDDGSRVPAPLAAILMLFSLVWFYGSFLLYIGMAASRNRFSPSILRAYAVSFALVIVFSIAYHPTGISAWAATLIGGNVLFPAVMYGWFFGDALRLRGRM